MKKMMVAMGAAAMAAACMAGEIRVEGHGKVSVSPDMMRIRFDVEAVDLDMAKSAEIFGAKNAAVTKALLDAGVATNEVTTSGVAMEPRYHYEDKNGNNLGPWGDGKRVFDGYCHSAECRFSAPLDRERLEKIYKVVVGCKTGTEIHLDFFVKDTKKAQSQARRRAVKNAQASAKELCAAAGVTLGGVEKIDYTTRCRNDFDMCCASAPYGRAKCAEPVLPAIKIRDIEVSDSVEMTWKTE